MTLKELSKMTLESLQICIEEGVSPDDVYIFAGSSNSDSKQIPRAEMRLGQNSSGDKRFALCFFTNDD